MLNGAPQVSICLSTVCRADIAKRRSYIETVQTSIKKLEEEIRVKQSTGNHNKANAKRYDSVKKKMTR